MIFEDAKKLLLGRLARFSAVDALDSYILLEMRAAQARLENGPTMPWFLFNTSPTVTTTEGQTSFPVPEDFIRPAEGYHGVVEDPDGGKSKLYIVSPPIPDYHEGLRPKQVYLANEEFVFPGPVVAGFKLTLPYYKHDAVVAEGAENGWLKNFPDLLLAETGLLIASGYLEHRGAMNLFQGMLADQRRALAVANIAREEAGLLSNPID